MKKILSSLGPGAHRLIRMLYLVIIVVLAIFAFRTWQQLQALRNVPVALPNFWFHVTGEPGQLRITGNGTWLEPTAPAKQAATANGRLQTSAIECNQARMQCLESVAVVEVMQKSFMEAHARIYDIEQWNANDVVTRAVQIDKCRMQVITLNIAEKSITAQVALPSDRTADMCKGVPASLKLEDGSKLLERVTKG
jgi:hypothetical protein